ncbi:inversin [Gastrophryne carolinensis]
MSSPPQGSTLASPVHAAAVTGDKASLLRLIGANAELLNQEDQLGRTPLMYSVLGDRRTCTEALLRHGAQVNHSDKSGRTALHLAALTGNHRLLKLLLSRRADCTQRDLRDITALHLSTRHQDTRCLALLLKHTPAGQVDAQDQRKQTALHWSAYYNRPRHVRLLVRHGSNIGIPDTEGKIPLHWAAGHKDPEAALTVRCLLEAAPTESLLNWQDYEGRTPLHLAVGDGNEEVVRLLTSYRGCNVAPYDNLFRTPLHWAALLGHTPIANLLLERNRSPNIPSDSQGATPLHYAAQGNSPDTVRVLLSHPSVRDEADLEGRTAFMWAAGKGSDEALKVMFELDPELEINRTDKYGGTALHAASLSGQISTVRILLEHGAQVDAADVMKHTPLFRACEMGHREVIYTLIKGEAKVHLVDKDGRSPLHWAALGGNANVCQILIENNINPNAQDYEGRTPLQCAAYGGYIGCMEVLMENKADPNIQDKNGRTALHWSCNNGYLDAVKLLLHYSAFPNQMESTEERYTPLDYALLGGHQEVTQFMLEHGALSIAAIQDIAASKIQAVYKGHKVRRAFRERKNLLMKHEQLRKDAAAKKREGESKRKVVQKEDKPAKMNDQEEQHEQNKSTTKEWIQMSLKEHHHQSKTNQSPHDRHASPREVSENCNQNSPRRTSYSKSSLTELEYCEKSVNDKPDQLKKNSRDKKKNNSTSSTPEELHQSQKEARRKSHRELREGSQHTPNSSPIHCLHKDEASEKVIGQQEIAEQIKGSRSHKHSSHKRENGSTSSTPDKLCQSQKEACRKSHRELREGSLQTPNSSPIHCLHKDEASEKVIGQQEIAEQIKGSRSHKHSSHKRENGSTSSTPDKLCQSQKEACRKSHRELREGSLQTPDSSHGHVEALDIIGQIKESKPHKNKRTEVDTISQIMDSCSITEHRRGIKESAAIGNQVTSDRDNSLKPKEFPGRRHSERKSSSGRARQHPLGTGRQTALQEERPSRWNKHSTSSSRSRQVRQTDTDKTTVNCSLANDINFRRSATILLPRDSLRAGHGITQWQHLDIELIPLEARLQLVEREKARKQLFQRKNHAAAVIQQAWRKHRKKGITAEHSPHKR